MNQTSLSPSRSRLKGRPFCEATSSTAPKVAAKAQKRPPGKWHGQRAIAAVAVQHCLICFLCLVCNGEMSGFSPFVPNCCVWFWGSVWSPVRAEEPSTAPTSVYRSRVQLDFLFHSGNNSAHPKQSLIAFLCFLPTRILYDRYQSMFD